MKDNDSQKLEMKDNDRQTTAEIVLDSVNPNGDRLTTWKLTFPRFIHAEFMTHRMLSRNAASSRAIPFATLVKKVIDKPAHPEFWGGAKPGMQSGEALTGTDLAVCQEVWEDTMMDAAESAMDLDERGLHKSITNRILEPWVRYTVLTSATDWHNFFALRAHPDAQPEFQVLAFRMLDAYLKSTPVRMGWGEWHIPFGDRMPEGLDDDTRIKVAIARAARVSYETFEGEIDVTKDLALYTRLMGSAPLHASPAEHVARAEKHLWLNTDVDMDDWICGRHGCDYTVTPYRNHDCASSWALPWSEFMVHQGNFRGWTQWRKMQPYESVERADLEAIMARKPGWIEL